MKTITLIVGLFSCLAVFGQSQELQTYQINDHLAIAATKGTYQFVFYSDQAQAISIDRELLVKIEAKRMESNESYLLINDTALVRILPKAIINQSDFTPVAEESIVNKKLFQEMKSHSTL